MNILENIVRFKQQEVMYRSLMISERDLVRSLPSKRPCNSLVQSLADNNKVPIIAEYKRKSPTKGVINVHATVSEVTDGYVNAGAAGLSILTDEPWFGGDVDHLTESRRRHPNIPILRKEFIISPYQIIESAVLAADVVLLIASILSKDAICSYTALAHDLGMEVLLELHDRSEIEKIDSHTDLFGINSRNLHNFEVHLSHTVAMKNYLPETVPVIAESGISSAEDAKMLLEHGFNGLLIGSHFMQSDDPGKRMSTFVKQLKK